MFLNFILKQKNINYFNKKKYDIFSYFDNIFFFLFFESILTPITPPIIPLIMELIIIIIDSKFNSNPTKHIL